MNGENRAALKLLVIVTPNFNMAATVGFLDPFRAANYLEGSILFRWEVASASGGEVMASNGMSIATRPLHDVRGGVPDVVIVSSSWTPESYNSTRLRGALQQWARAGRLWAPPPCSISVLVPAALPLFANATRRASTAGGTISEHCISMTRWRPS